MNTINTCNRTPNWNACKWRDENTELSVDSKHILCHTQDPNHKCCGLCKVNVETESNYD